jgi:hypothetical protein
MWIAIQIREEIRLAELSRQKSFGSATSNPFILSHPAVPAVAGVFFLKDSDYFYHCFESNQEHLLK